MKFQQNLLSWQFRGFYGLRGGLAEWEGGEGNKNKRGLKTNKVGVNEIVETWRRIHNASFSLWRMNGTNKLEACLH